MKKIIKVTILIIVIIFEIALIKGCESEFGYAGELGDLEKELRVALDVSAIDQIHYKDVHYYDKVLEKGDDEYQAFAIFHYSSSGWEAILSETENVFEIPVDTNLIEFVMEKNALNTCDMVNIKEINDGYYGVYSFKSKRLLTMDEIKEIQIDTLSSDYRDLFIFQYDKTDRYLYCFEIHI